MKITDQLILAMSDNHDWEKDINGIKFARKLIELAQEVEPLKFDKIQNATLACSMFGTYSIEQVGGRYCFRVQRFYENRRFESEEEAIEAAQQDYDKRVKSGLKYGGVE